MEIKVEEKDVRIDQYLVNKLDYSRNKIEKLIKNKDILVNSEQIKKSYILKEGDIITINEIVEEEFGGETDGLDK